jgi:hypothetical protein
VSVGGRRRPRRLLGTKTSRARTLSVGRSVVEALRRRRDDQARERQEAPVWKDRWGLVFTEPDGSPMNPIRLTVQFCDLVRRAPVPPGYEEPGPGTFRLIPEQSSEHGKRRS